MKTHCPHGEHFGNHCAICESEANKPTPASEIVTWDEHEKSMQAQWAEANAQLAALQDDKAMMTGQIEELRDEVANAQIECGSAQHQLTAATQRAEKAEEELKAIRAEWNRGLITIGDLTETAERMKDEIDQLRAELAEEKRIVNSVWSALGITTYEQAKGLTISEWVKQLRSDKEKAVAALANLSNAAAMLCSSTSGIDASSVKVARAAVMAELGLKDHQ